IPAAPQLRLDDLMSSRLRIRSQDRGREMTSAAQVQPAMPAKRILVVEDELMIRMLLEDMLGELGYTVTAEAGRLDEALQAAKTADFDLAILDVNLDGEPASPAARRSSSPPVTANAACPNLIATGRCSRSRFRWMGSKKCCKSRLQPGRIEIAVQRARAKF